MNSGKHALHVMTRDPIHIVQFMARKYIQLLFRAHQSDYRNHILKAVSCTGKDRPYVCPDHQQWFVITVPFLMFRCV